MSSWIFDKSSILFLYSIEYLIEVANSERVLRKYQLDEINDRVFSFSEILILCCCTQIKNNSLSLFFFLNSEICTIKSHGTKMKFYYSPETAFGKIILWSKTPSHLYCYGFCGKEKHKW